MLCAIYKSKKKPGSYLYIAKREDFSQVPEVLLSHFGKPELVMMFNLLGSKPLHNVDWKKLNNKDFICKYQNKMMVYLIA